MSGQLEMTDKESSTVVTLRFVKTWTADCDSQMFRAEQ